MRVLMLSWEYPPHTVGGLGKHVVELLPALSACGVEVILVTPRWLGGERRERVAEGITVVRADVPSRVENFSFFANTRRANELLRQAAEDEIDRLGGVDVIHAHDWLVGFAATDLKHEYKLPLLVTIHATEWGRSHGSLGSDTQRSVHNAEWQLTFEAWRVITASGYMANEVMAIFQTPHDKIDVIPNGVDTSKFDALAGADLSALRARFALPSERIVFSVGRLVHEKGFQVLVDAAPYVLNAVPDAKFVLAGTGPTSPDLQRRAGENGLGAKFYFAGFVTDDVRDGLLRLADVAVFPSLYEPFGIVALEAMAAKAPVVATSVGGLAEVVRHNETGLTVYPDDPKSLAWGIQQALQYPYWARRRVQNAYEMVVAEYNWHSIAQRTQNVYERLVRERAAAGW
ncbi:MAG: glycosyltransferase family 4 protein [Chloroflexi bacterium]|nr:glycosyltransferase family 4 protein [Chloroflexota bacterium]MCL5108206.1 glycosyltransferase family 4 protein [Chloroflexota bacterium]